MNERKYHLLLGELSARSYSCLDVVHLQDAFVSSLCIYQISWCYTARLFIALMRLCLTLASPVILGTIRNVPQLEQAVIKKIVQFTVGSYQQCDHLVLAG